MPKLPDAEREIVQDAGQDLFQMPELPKDVVYCNICSINGDGGAVIEGTIEDALAAGWQERNWGPTCPKCQSDLDGLDEGVVDSGGLKVLGDFLATNLTKV